MKIIIKRTDVHSKTVPGPRAPWTEMDSTDCKSSISFAISGVNGCK